jgi:nitrilase
MASQHQKPWIVAAAPQIPRLLDRDAALELACELIVDAGDMGAELIVFPAGFLPGYPEWIWSIPPGEHEQINALLDRARRDAVRIPSEVTDRLCRVAQRAHINVVIGLIELDDTATRPVWYSTLLIIDMQGHLLEGFRAARFPDLASIVQHAYPFQRSSAPASAELHHEPVGGI